MMVEKKGWQKYNWFERTSQSMYNTKMHSKQTWSHEEHEQPMKLKFEWISYFLWCCTFVDSLVVALVL
jgi:hypothetical protein